LFAWLIADVPPPPIGKGTETLSTGWHYNIYNQEVDRGCSSCIYHSTYSDTKTTSQGTIWLYSSKLLALQAMRAQIEREFAKKLADLDLLIEQENGGAEGP
jgi:hypothetical protein